MARRAPSASASNLARTIVGWISGVYVAWEEKPQSALATTFSRPTSSANRVIRSAIVSGCSTMEVAWLMTPGRSTAPSGGLTDSNTWYACSCRGLAASKENAPASMVNSVSDHVRQLARRAPGGRR